MGYIFADLRVIENFLAAKDHTRIICYCTDNGNSHRRRGPHPPFARDRRNDLYIKPPASLRDAQAVKQRRHEFLEVAQVSGRIHKTACKILAVNGEPGIISRRTISAYFGTDLSTHQRQRNSRLEMYNGMLPYKDDLSVRGTAVLCFLAHTRLSYTTNITHDPPYTALPFPAHFRLYLCRICA